MIPEVKTVSRDIEEYRGIVSNSLLEEIKSLAQKIQGLKVIHINATPQGGGVAEILKSLVPLMKGVGLKAEWHILPPDNNFFTLTKEIHNDLQGQNSHFSLSSQEIYTNYLKKIAKLMEDMKSDLWVIHDPQPLGLIKFKSDLHPSILRIHIDTSHPNNGVLDFFRPLMLRYDRLIFSSEEFIHSSIIRNKVSIFHPAIDPLTKKNIPLPLGKAKSIIRGFGLNPDNPLMTQVARFDPWKDPLGALKIYRTVKKKVPNLQMAFLGLSLAKDDPESQKVFESVKREARGDKDIFLFFNPKVLDSLDVGTFVNAFQTASTVILQKSIREGFALSVTEAMWKGKVVVGGNAGGIKIQIKDGENGFLVSDCSQAAERVYQVIQDKGLRERLGRAARETVREKFLIPRLLRDYLRLFQTLV